ncbi:MAG: ComF family protein [Patescibacteria group bacterium]|jgi:ComF family protein
MLNWLLDWIFPVRCLGCKQWDVWLCKHCLATLQPNNHSIHYRLLNIPAGIKNLYYLNRYQHSLLQLAIHTLKYDAVFKLSVPLGNLLAELLPKDAYYDYVIPVPIHPQRYRERGFNQSTLLAKQLPFTLNEQLKRIRYTTAQANLKRAERLTNMNQAFYYYPTIPLINKKILLIDDVYTTGTTLNTCANILYKHNAKQVDGLVLALD